MAGDDEATKELVAEYYARKPAFDEATGNGKSKQQHREEEDQKDRAPPQLLKDLTESDINFLDFAREDAPIDVRATASLSKSEEKFLEGMSDEEKLSLSLIANRWKQQSSKALYVYAGLKYCITHKSVWFPILTYLLINILLTTAVFLFLGLLTGSLQYKWVQATIDPNDDENNDNDGEVDDFDEWFALFYTLYLLIIETTIITRIIGGIFLDRAKREIFDIAFASEKPVLLDPESDLHIKRMSTAPTKERLQVTAFIIGTMVVMELLTAPLLIMPIIGQILACLVTSWASSWVLLTAFFTRQGLNLKWQSKLVYMRFGEYMAFGVPVTIIQHIPIVSSLFVFVDVTGAALWAVDMASLSNAFRYIKFNAEDQAKKAAMVLESTVGLTPSNSLGAMELDAEEALLEEPDLPDGFDEKYEVVNPDSDDELSFV